MIESSEYSLRRTKLFNLVEDNTVTILFSGVEKIKSADEAYDFVPNKNFYYLTGIEQPNSILMLVKSYGQKLTYLFIDEKDEKIEKWIGIKMSADHAKSISGIDNVLLRSTFDGKLMAFFDTNNQKYEPISKFYLDLSPEIKIDKEKSTVIFKNELELDHNVEVIDIAPIIYKMRSVKSATEVEMIREAITCTDYALKKVLIALEPGKYEYNMRNVFNNAVFDDQDAKLGFSTIVASGANAVILHYPTQKSRINKGDLVLFDLGASKGYYSADVSRTYPVGGFFCGKQKIIYNIVLNCNKRVCKFMRPGVTLKEANEFTKNFLADECVEQGLISSKEDISKVYYHSVSHHLGLDVHDGPRSEEPLVPGNVVTVEPGLYFKELGIGVRIEDDVLITEDGSEVLTKDIVKDTILVERLLGSKE